MNVQTLVSKDEVRVMGRETTRDSDSVLLVWYLLHLHHKEIMISFVPAVIVLVLTCLGKLFN